MILHWVMSDGHQGDALSPQWSPDRSRSEQFSMYVLLK